MLRKNIDEYNENVFSEFGKTYGIVTAGDKKNGFNSLTVSWGGLGVLWGKNVAYIFIRGSRHTFQFLEKSESVTLSFLDEPYAKAVKILGTTSGKDTNKMLLANLHYTYDPDYDGAYIKEASYCFKMKKLYSNPLPFDALPEELKKQYYSEGDMHTMFVCEIKQFLVRGNQ